MMTLLFASIGLATAQSFTVSGTVVAEEDGQPIVGAYAVVSGTTLGAMTDIDGHFTISGVPADATQLVVSLLGMSTEAVQISKSPMIIKMHQDITVLDGTIVTALGISRSEKAIGYAATKVGGTRLLRHAMPMPLMRSLVRLPV